MGKSKVVKLKGSNGRKADANENEEFSEAEAKKLIEGFLIDSQLRETKARLFDAIFYGNVGDDELKTLCDDYLNIIINDRIEKLNTLLGIIAKQELKIVNPLQALLVSL